MNLPSIAQLGGVQPKFGIWEDLRSAGPRAKPGPLSTGTGSGSIHRMSGSMAGKSTRSHSRPCSASSRLCRRSRSKPVPTAEARGLSSGSTFAGGIQVDFATGVLHVRSAKAGTPATHPLTVRALGWRKGADSCQESDPDLLGSPGSEVFNLPGHERSAGDGED